MITEFSSQETGRLTTIGNSSNNVRAIRKYGAALSVSVVGYASTFVTKRCNSRAFSRI